MTAEFHCCHSCSAGNFGTLEGQESCVSLWDLEDSLFILPQQTSSLFTFLQLLFLTPHTRAFEEHASNQGKPSFPITIATQSTSAYPLDQSLVQDDSFQSVHRATNARAFQPIFLLLTSITS